MRYVLGFMFSKSGERVVLIKKVKPDWQAGKLNGVGGKIEGDEKPIKAMVREYLEETGILTGENVWKLAAVMRGDPSVTAPYELHIFGAITASQENFESVHTTTDETVHKVFIDEVQYDNVLPNVRFLVPLAKLAAESVDFRALHIVD